MSEIVFDTSALLALLNREPGHEEVARTIPQAVVSTVNLSEVVAKLVESSMPGEAIREALDGLVLKVHAFERDLAYESGLLRTATRSRGLSLGDRACLALGHRLNLPVLTTDRVWEGLEVGVEVRLARS
ncbi:MAG: type II toxin-antitoxin system VapC family toxin [Rubrobacter sp.]|nr:type II toxin-antitoxin system VapC family toxin [Rubrobacter sp.]